MEAFIVQVKKKKNRDENVAQGLKKKKANARHKCDIKIHNYEF